VQLAFDQSTAVAAENKAAHERFEALAADFSAVTGAPAADDTAFARVDELPPRLADAAAALDSAAGQLEAAAAATAAAARAAPSPDATALAEQAQARAKEARAAADAARSRASDSVKAAHDYVERETGDVQLVLDAADAAIAAGNLSEAKQHLDKATELTRKAPRRGRIEYLYAQLFDLQARRSRDPAAQRKLLEQARDAYQHFASTGSGALVRRASDRAAEISEDLGAPP
jgi:hypothetical protein